MTDPRRDSHANERLTTALRAKCGEPRLRVMLIRPGTAPSSVLVNMQLDLHKSQFKVLEPIEVQVDRSLGLEQHRPCLDDDVVDAVAVAFPCDLLRSQLG